jgi:hypothetical protein
VGVFPAFSRKDETADRVYNPAISSDAASRELLAMHGARFGAFDNNFSFPSPPPPPTIDVPLDQRADRARAGMAVFLVVAVITVGHSRSSKRARPDWISEVWPEVFDPSSLSRRGPLKTAAHKPGGSNASAGVDGMVTGLQAQLLRCRAPFEFAVGRGRGGVAGERPLRAAASNLEPQGLQSLHSEQMHLSPALVSARVVA